jgi:acyl-ACP thioesterase
MLDAVDDLVPEPDVGRRFRTTRRVRLADADATGRLRLDALARLLQDVGNDDFADAGLDPGSPWVARRSVVEAHGWPQLGDRLRLTTWCGGLGGRWGERRTSVVGEASGRVEVASLWVFLGDDGARPTKLPDWFLETYGGAALGRTVKARLRLPAPPADGTDDRPWALRSTDLDVLGHVNNAATWAAVEDEGARRHVVPGRAELEYGSALEPGDDVVLRSCAADGGGFSLWLTVAGEVRAAAAVRPA